MLFNRKRPKMSGVVPVCVLRNRTNQVRVIAIEEQRSQPLPGRNVNHCSAGQYSYYHEIDECRWDDSANPANVEALQIDASEASLFVQEARTDENPADSKEDIYAKASLVVKPLRAKDPEGMD